MIQYITENIGAQTLGEFISKNYAEFKQVFGSASLDTDITHGVEVETHDNSKYGHGVTVWIYPFIKWSDGIYKPCHYWGKQYYITIERS